MVKVVIGTKVCSFEEMLEEYGRVCEENEELKKQISELKVDLLIKENMLDNAIRDKRTSEENISLADLFGDCDEEFDSDEYEDDFPEELRSKDLNFNLVSKMLDVIELMLTDTQG